MIEDWLINGLPGIPFSEIPLRKDWWEKGWKKKEVSFLCVFTAFLWCIYSRSLQRLWKSECKINLCSCGCVYKFQFLHGVRWCVKAFLLKYTKTSMFHFIHFTFVLLHYCRRKPTSSFFLGSLNYLAFGFLYPRSFVSIVYALIILSWIFSFLPFWYV